MTKGVQFFFGLLFTLFLLYSFKYLTFLCHPQIYDYFISLSHFNSLPQGIHNQYVLEYPKVIGTLNLIGALSLIVSSIIAIIFYWKRKEYIELIVILISVWSIWFLGGIKFSSFSFYNLVPKSLFDIKYYRFYLFSNWLLFLAIIYISWRVKFRPLSKPISSS